MGKKLLQKAGAIGLPSPPVRPVGVAVSASQGKSPGQGVAPRPDLARAKTAPGTMLGFMTAQSAAIQEADELRARLDEFGGALPARRLDPASVVPSAWANRHEQAYADVAFAELKAEISSAGGNVQAIKVRPIVAEVGARHQGVGRSNPPAAPSATSASTPAAARYEIVFGHRRHRACLELGLPVLAVVESLSEQDLFVQMERENRSRKDLSAWEQGMMYARALEQGLYPSNRQLALAVGRDLGDLGKALSLARLPKAVVDAFASPLDLQFRWAKPLSEAQQKDPELLLARAEALRQANQGLAARQVLQALLDPAPAAGVGPSNPPAEPLRIQHQGKTLASMTTDAQGRTVVTIDVALNPAQRRSLQHLLQDLLA